MNKKLENKMNELFPVHEFDITYAEILLSRNLSIQNALKMEGFKACHEILEPLLKETLACLEICRAMDELRGLPDHRIPANAMLKKIKAEIGDEVEG